MGSSLVYQVPIPGTYKHYFTWHRHCRCLKLRILRWGNHRGLSGGALNAIACIILRGRKREIWLHIEERKIWRWSRGNLKIMALKTQVVQHKRRNASSHQGWKGQFSTNASRGSVAHSHLHFGQVVLISDFRTQELWENKSQLFKVTRFYGYSSHQKLIHSFNYFFL